MGMTDAQVLVAKGRQEGRQELLLEMLEARFGQLPSSAGERLSALTDSELSAITRKVLFAESLGALGLA
jgi:hypothetical protein